jgi:LacI family transcriptional regulator/LacI family purine nucleotide synthesis repressor
MKKRRVTLQAVAERAGVNRVTAAVALGRSPQGGTRVSAATRLRVEEAAHELGYAPNAIAQALRGKRTNILGYYAGYEALDAHSPFTAAILRGLQHSCRTYNQDLLLFGSFIRDTVDSIYSTLTSGKIDGLVLLPTPRSPMMDRLFGSHLPVVAIANSHPHAPSVIVDDVAGSTMIADYLAQQGHRHVLYRTQEEARASTLNRQSAFCERAQALGMRVELVYEGEAQRAMTQAEMDVLRRPSHERPTAAVCWMDVSAYRLLDYCESIGLAVPDDLAIVGYDGVSLSIRPKRSLTTVCAPWADVAAKAVEYVQWLLEGKEVPSQTILPVQFSIGDTT